MTADRRQYISGFVNAQIFDAIEEIKIKESCSRSHALELALQESLLIKKHIRKTATS